MLKQVLCWSSQKVMWLSLTRVAVLEFVAPAGEPVAVRLLSQLLLMC